MRQDTREHMEAERFGELLGCVLLTISMFWIGFSVNYWPIRKESGNVESIHGDQVPWHRKDRNRAVVWDEIREGDFYGTNAFNLP